MKARTLIRVILLFICMVSVETEARTWHVKVDGSGDVPTLQAAVDTAAPGDVVLVGPGRYTWANQGTGVVYALVNFLRGRNGFTFRSESGPDATILDAQGQGWVIFLQGYNNVTIKGFTITGGDPPFTEEYGGGINAHLSNDVIKNCVFTGNNAEVGGGLCCHGWCTTLVENCTFAGNHATRYGGGVSLSGSQTTITVTDCVIKNNTAGDGAGMLLAYAAVSLENTVIAGNTADNSGGGIYFMTTWPITVTGCTISENRATDAGGMMVFGASTITMTGNIVSFARGGGGIAVEPEASVQIGCTNLYGNTGGDVWPPEAIDIGGNFSMDPLFCGPRGSFDFSLREDSPCLPGQHPGGDNCGLIGAFSSACGNVPARQSTWGAVKALYRD